MTAQRKRVPPPETAAVSSPCPACQSPVFQPLMAGRHPVCPVCDTPWRADHAIKYSTEKRLDEVA